MAEKTKIPANLKKKLEEDDRLSGFVNSSLSSFSPWLAENRVKFFAEFTDHSLKHAEAVLETADRLIREDCRSIISAGDVATLIVATLLHDCAMHLSVDGFVTLLKSNQKIPEFDDKSWSMLWENFIVEVHRFSGRELMALFGDIKAIKPPPSNPNDLNSHELTGRDLLLIGEFLRRHHHRLGHEIAVYGVPGPSSDRLKLPEDSATEYVMRLAGVVARSHGLPIRACHDFLNDNFGNKTSFKDVHPVFLMALLRLADVLQLQSDRAPEYVKKVRQINSPVSQLEWEMHQGIKDINWMTEYPETVFIHAEPPDARTFIKIRNLLAQIQTELDTSWAAISEVFFAVEPLQKLGLSIRRVRSNLDEVETFSKNVKYIPCEASLEVANADLLKLLIGPLYGDRPEFGIRELMQNALDAVWEVREYQRKHPDLGDVQFEKQEAEVVISINKEKDGWWVTVSDQGIGMTLGTVRNYFLMAGASLRRSEIWRETFVDDQGKSRVMRSGRFGIGVLASFLLGDKIHVSTRHISEPEEKGIAFSCKLDEHIVELRKIKRPVGTTIRVHINKKVKEELLGTWDEENGKWKNQDKWDWYCLTDPKVIRKINQGQKLTQRYQMPPIKSELSVGWNRIATPDYKDIQWTYSDAPALTCNGIKIVDHKIFLGFFYGDLIMPNVSVFDFDANLPLNLQRTKFSQREYPFFTTLLDDVLKDLIAFTFVNIPFQPIAEISIYEWYKMFLYSGMLLEHIMPNHRFFPWFFTETGISLTDCTWSMNQINSHYALIIQIYYGGMFAPSVTQKSSQAIFCRGHLKDSSSNIEQAEELEKIIECAFNILQHGIRDRLARLFSEGKRVLISRHVLRFIKNVSESEKKDLLSEIPVSEIVEEWENENWVLWRLGDCPPVGFDYEKFAAENDGKNFDEWPCILTEWYFKEEKPNIEELSPLDKVWKEMVGSPIIPFDPEERRRMKAFKELKSYIEAHERLKQRK